MSRIPGKAYPLSLKKKAIRRCLEGETEKSVCTSFGISHGAMTMWKKKYGAEVAKEIAAGPAITNRLEPGTKAEPEAQAPPQQHPKRARTPLGDRGLLTFPEGDHSKYAYRGVVEDDRRVGRVEDFKEAGWEPVPKKKGRFGHEALDAPEAPGSVISRASGLGATTYLMRKRLDEEAEDLARTVLAPAQKLEEAIYGELDKPGRFGKVTLGSRTEERKA